MRPYTRFLQKLPQSLHPQVIPISSHVILPLSTRFNSTTAPPPEKPYSEMNNYEKFRHDLKAAMRARDMATLNPLKALLTAHQAKAKQSTVNDPEKTDSHFANDNFLAPLIHKQISKRKDSLVGFKEYHRTDLVEKEEFEISVLEKYLPQPQTTEEDIRNLTIEAFETLRSEGKGANDPGSMGIKRIYEWLKKDGKRREMMSEKFADAGMVRRVIAETVRDLSDRPDASPEFNVERLKPREKDDLTKDRYQ